MNRFLKIGLIATSILACIGIGSFSHEILELIVSCGHRIPSSDILSDYFIGVFWAVAFFFIILFSCMNPVHKSAFLVIWLSKCLVTLGVMLIYENAYGLDAYYYFQSASSPIPSWHGFAFGQGTDLVTTISWVLIHIGNIGVSYHALKVIFSMIGLLGIYFFYLGVVDITGNKNPRNLYLLALFPSVLFWSSILGKDPLNLFGIGLYFFGASKWYRKEKLIYLVYVIAGISIATLIRSWYLAILSFPFLVLMLRSWHTKKNAGKISIIAIFFGMVAVLGSLMRILTVSLHADDLTHAISTTNTISHSWSYGGSAVSEIPKFTSLAGIITFAPYGIFTALFRPLPGEVMNGFGLIAGLENVFLIYLMCRFVFFSHFKDWLRGGLGTWLSLLIFLWSALYAFISPQNLGSAVRFKLQILPVMLVMIILGKWRKDQALCAE